MFENRLRQFDPPNTDSYEELGDQMFKLKSLITDLQLELNSLKHGMPQSDMSELQSKISEAIDSKIMKISEQIGEIKQSQKRINEEIEVLKDSTAELASSMIGISQTLQDHKRYFDNIKHNMDYFNQRLSGGVVTKEPISPTSGPTQASDDYDIYR